MSNSMYQGALLQIKAHSLLRSYIYTRLQTYGINPTQWALLSQLYENADGLRASHLAQTLGVKNPLITMLAEKIVANKWVRRAPDPHDKRAKLLLLTPAGRTAVEEIDSFLQESLKQLMQGVTQKDLVAYQKVLLAILKNKNSTQTL